MTKIHPLLFTTALEKKKAEQKRIEVKKIKVRAYRFRGTLREEFSSAEEAQNFISKVSKKYPNMLFTSYEERRTGKERRKVVDRRNKADRRSGIQLGRK
jgi:hypothetical protein